MVALSEFGKSGWSSGRAGFRPSAMGTPLRNPVLGSMLRLPVRPSSPTLGDPKADAQAIAAKLREGANMIVANGESLGATLDRVYTQYESSATENRLIGALRAAYNTVRASDPFMTYIMGNVDNQALVRLQVAERMGNQWLTSIKDSWFGEGPDGVNMHEALIQVDNDLALQVESAFDRVQASTADVSKLSRQVESLPEEILSRGVDYYAGGLKSAGKELWFDVASILRTIKAILDAAGVAGHDISNFLDAAFPKPKSGTGAPGSNASTFPAPGTLILVGLGVFAIYLVLR